MKRRKQAGLTQQQLATQLGVAVRTVQGWESGEYVPTLNPLQSMQLCKILGCSIDELAQEFFPEHFSINAAEPGGNYAN